MATTNTTVHNIAVRITGSASSYLRAIQAATKATIAFQNAVVVAQGLVSGAFDAMMLKGVASLGALSAAIQSTVGKVVVMQTTINNYNNQTIHNYASSTRGAAALTSIFSERIKNLGNNLMWSGLRMVMLTAPFAMFFRTASRNAMVLESFRKGLEIITNDTEKYEKALRNIHELAKMPGIGLFEAYEAQTKMMSMGFGVDRASLIIQEFGNAIAFTSAHARADLAGVMRQIAQMASKQKVMMQDLNIVLERAPRVAVALRAAFGTINAKDIMAKAKNFDNFMTILLKQMVKMERAAAGSANTLENFKDVWTQLSAAIGASILEITVPLMEKMIPLVERFVEWWNSLGSTIKKTIVIFIGVVGVLGPFLLFLGLLIRAIGVLISISAGLLTSFVSLMLVHRLLASGVSTLYAAIQGLAAVVSYLLTPFGMLVGIMGSLRVGLLAVQVSSIDWINVFLKYGKYTLGFFANFTHNMKVLSDFIGEVVTLTRESLSKMIDFDFLVDVLNEILVRWQKFVSATVGFISNIGENWKILVNNLKDNWIEFSFWLVGALKAVGKNVASFFGRAMKEVRLALVEVALSSTALTEAERAKMTAEARKLRRELAEDLDLESIRGLNLKVPKFITEISSIGVGLLDIPRILAKRMRFELGKVESPIGRLRDGIEDVGDAAAYAGEEIAKMFRPFDAVARGSAAYLLLVQQALSTRFASTAPLDGERRDGGRGRGIDPFTGMPVRGFDPWASPESRWHSGFAPTLAAGEPSPEDKKVYGVWAEMAKDLSLLRGIWERTPTFVLSPLDAE